MSDYYTGKEVLLGLKQELKNLDRELRELDKMIVYYNDERYKGSYFFNRVAQKQKSLTYNLNTNYTLKEKIKSVLLYRDDLFNYPNIYLNTTLDQNGNHILLNDDKNLVIKEKQEEFNEKVERLFNSNFVSEINNLEYDTHSLAICSEKIVHFDCDEKLGKNALSFGYHIIDDSVYIYVTGKNRLRTLSSVIDEVLSIKIPKNKFTPFLQQIIEENPETKKEIYVPFETLLLCHGTKSYYLNKEKVEYVLTKK